VRLHRLAPAASLAAAGIALGASLLAPASYAVATVNSAISGGDPHPGPGTVDSRGGFAGFGGQQGGGTPPTGLAPSGAAGSGTAGSQARSFGAASGSGGSSVDSTLVSYLVANKGSATWIVAVSGSQTAGTLEIESGQPVMAMGGFTGSDPTPTLDQLKAYISSGELRFVLTGGTGGGFGGNDSSSISSWVTSTCTAVDYAGSGSSSLFDCSAAAS